MQTSPKHLAAALLAVAAGACAAASGEGPGENRAPSQKKRPEQQPQITCAISPELCMSDPIARGCGDGRHWSAAGSGTAHCVDDDRNCADGKAAKRDEYDNLVCADEKAAGTEG